MKNRTTALLLTTFISANLSSYVFANQSQCEKAEAARALRCTTYRQTTNYTCGPAAVMSLMKYFGKIKSSQMNQATEMRIAREMNATEKGTSPGQLMSWLSDQGFSVSSGTCVTSSMIKNNIDRGMPTIVAYQQHWLLAKGYIQNSSQDVIIFADSACGTTSLSSQTVDMLWSMGSMKQNTCGIHEGYYITATPSR